MAGSFYGTKSEIWAGTMVEVIKWSTQQQILKYFINQTVFNSKKLICRNEERVVMLKNIFYRLRAAI